MPLPVDDPVKRCPDISLAKKILDWEPKTELTVGLNNTFSWFKEKINELLKKKNEKKIK